jgi:hypothetical protein
MEYPYEIDEVLSDWMTDAKITSTQEMPGDATADIMYNGNPVAENVPLGGMTEVYLSELLGSGEGTRTPIVNHAGLTDVWTITITSEFLIDTDITINSVISNDGFVTDKTIATNASDPVHVTQSSTYMDVEVSAGNKITVTIEYPDTIDEVLSDWMTDAKITSTQPMPEDATADIMYNGNPVAENVPLGGMTEVYLSELLGSGEGTRTPVVNHAGLTDVWTITITSGSPTIDTDITINSVISNDGFVTDKTIASYPPVHVSNEF